MTVEEITVGAKSEWIDANVAEFAAGFGAMCILIKRGEELIAPDGRTTVKSGDEVIISRRNPGGKM